MINIYKHTLPEINMLRPWKSSENEISSWEGLFFRGYMSFGEWKHYFWMFPNKMSICFNWIMGSFGICLLLALEILRVLTDSVLKWREVAVYRFAPVQASKLVTKNHVMARYGSTLMSPKRFRFNTYCTSVVSIYSISSSFTWFSWQWLTMSQYSRCYLRGTVVS